MPELPEVEVTRLSFVDRIRGARVQSVVLGKPLRWPFGGEPATLAGQQVLDVRRRGKYLLIDLTDGVLMVHLGMSGSLSFAPTLAPRGVHDHFDLVTTAGTLRLNDPRRFGAVIYTEGEHSAVAQKLLGRLGVEPLGDGFDLLQFCQELKQRKAPVKQVLLAGEVVVGVGNIYASEALFMARIRPTTPASKLSRVRVARLHAAIRAVLAQAVASGGSTLRNFSSAAGNHGSFQTEAQVYAREGEPCEVCGSAIRMIRQGQRSTFFCGQCQKA
jgi:formamidopyrimidine-DNA glycosylase